MKTGAVSWGGPSGVGEGAFNRECDGDLFVARAPDCWTAGGAQSPPSVWEARWRGLLPGEISQ